ncbi:MAG TPA: hypothetical protein VN717_02655 [Gemmatimonadaceae bacterium]|nr:hypothetical protein [Gemmatimonadaceae bacterium]
MRRLALSTILAFALALAFGSVSTIAAQSDSAPPAKATSAAKQDPNRITADEIASAKRPTAYDVVDHLRRQWLRKDMLTGEDVVIYMDEQNLGGADKLRDIPTVDVAEFQFLPHNDAVKRWGSDIKGSVIVVSRRR